MSGVAISLSYVSRFLFDNSLLGKPVFLENKITEKAILVVEQKQLHPLFIRE